MDAPPRPNRKSVRPTSTPALIFYALLLITAIATVQGKDAAGSPTDESIDLPKVMVKGVPVCSFGIGIVYTRETDTKRIKRVFITEVSPGSMAEENGLQAGDEILSINGQKVAGANGEIKPGSWLFDQLANREPGQSIDVEVAVRIVKKLKLRAFYPLDLPHSK